MSEPGEEPERPETAIWDALQDVVALVTALRSGDDEGLEVLMANCDRDMVLSTAIVLLAQMAGEHGADHRSLLAWGILALDKAT